jgi:hypothetical protein
MDTLSQFSFNIANLSKLYVDTHALNQDIYQLNTDTLTPFIFNMFNIDNLYQFNMDTFYPFMLK